MSKSDNYIAVTRKGRGLFPTDTLSEEKLHSLVYGKDYALHYEAVRSLAHHRQFFALLNLLVESGAVPFEGSKKSIVEALKEYLKMECGLVNMATINGKQVVWPKSISFARMNQHDFGDFYNTAMNVVLRDFLPHVKQEHLHEEISMIANGEYMK